LEKKGFRVCRDTFPLEKRDRLSDHHHNHGDTVCKKEGLSSVNFPTGGHQFFQATVAGSDADPAQILRDYRTVAVVGLSPKAERPSHQVALYLKEAGYEIIPVNPGHDELLGLRSYPDLAAVPQPVGIVAIFRNPREVPAIVDSAIAIGAKVVWMQLGIIHEEAAAKAQAAGLSVIMDRCMMIDHQNYFPRL
jgi:predicted CoA-binding protein